MPHRSLPPRWDPSLAPTVRHPRTIGAGRARCHPSDPLRARATKGVFPPAYTSPVSGHLNAHDTKLVVFVNVIEYSRSVILGRMDMSRRACSEWRYASQPAPASRQATSPDCPRRRRRVGVEHLLAVANVDRGSLHSSVDLNTLTVLVGDEGIATWVFWETSFGDVDSIDL